MRFGAVEQDVGVGEGLWGEAWRFGADEEVGVCGGLCEDFFGSAVSVDAGCVEFVDVMGFEDGEEGGELGWGGEEG